MSSAVLPAPNAPARPPRRRRSRLVLPVYTGLVMLYLVFPILIMVLYGFNRSNSDHLTFQWNGFTLDWYRRLFEISDLTAALRNSLFIAVVSTLIATVLGTLMGLALVRYRFRGKGSSELVLFMNIAAPEIVLGASLLALFVQLHIPLGILTIILAHVMFNVSYVAITVRARLVGFDRSLEEAAQDLGANAWTTFRKVTLPLIWPGVLAGALLAFALSIDDFVITNFVSGPKVTFPLWVFGAARVGIPPQVFVMGTLIFVFGVLLAAGNLFVQRSGKPLKP
ncbi:MAG TPA: ABC transporter permease [Actinobacteria bacterium]|nr:ABC transporter permease [Actinomycetota bacterium]